MPSGAIPTLSDVPSTASSALLLLLKFEAKCEHQTTQNSEVSEKVLSSSMKGIMVSSVFWNMTRSSSW